MEAIPLEARKCNFKEIGPGEAMQSEAKRTGKNSNWGRGTRWGAAQRMKGKPHPAGATRQQLM